MRSSSNLIEANSSDIFVGSWNPAGFQAKREDLPQNQPEIESECLPQSDPDMGIGNAFEMLVPPPAQMKPPQEKIAAPEKSSAEERVDVKFAWVPGEFKQIQKKTTEIPSEKPAVSHTHPVEDIRQKLILETLDEANKILTQAQNQASEIIANAENKAQEIMLTAQQQGWDAARQETTPMLSAVQEMVNQVRSWSEEMYATSKTAVFNLIQEIAHTIFCNGLDLDQELLEKTYSRILSNARSLGELRIYVNPNDASKLDPYWREYQETVLGQKIEIVPSESIIQGGCFVDGQLGTVDGRVETQYQAVMSALVGAMDNQEEIQ